MPVYHIMAAAVLCLYGAFVSAQAADARAAAFEALIWARFGGRDAGPNRWAEFAALCEASRSSRESADAEVDELVPDEGSYKIYGIDLNYHFLMVGTISSYEDDFLEPEKSYAGLKTPEERRAIFRAAEAVYIRMLDGMDGNGLIARLRELRESGDPVVRPLASGDVFKHPESLSELRELSQMLGLRMMLSAERADWDRYNDDLASLIWLGEVADRQGGMTSQIFGVAIHAIGFKRVREDVVRRRIPGSELNRIASTLSDVIPFDFASVLPAERLMISEVIDELHDENDRPEPVRLEGIFRAADFMDTTGRESPDVADLDLDSFPSGSEIEALVDDVWPTIVRDADQPAHIRWRSLHMYETYGQNWEHSALLPMLSVWAMAKGERVALQLASDLDGLHALLSIERYRRDHGEPPQGLADLVPEYLGSIPLDPLHDNQPLIYRRDDSELGYILYSVGYDGVDNGGVVHETSPYHAYSEDGAGSDVVFTESIGN